MSVEGGPDYDGAETSAIIEHMDRKQREEAAGNTGSNLTIGARVRYTNINLHGRGVVTDETPGEPWDSGDYVRVRWDGDFDAQVEWRLNLTTF